ncbi:high affinity immunoglobulin epsilon receptor subunit gamma [Periophthalmus magnuspinnatus]|uniref:high affinity immunoglobulin epsilon receptor subunit gamma n=1 Tax=Periophthalmus magnuspinnatus TaxID=409849 RepID=UPI00145B633B|nr:high affinity immunoglobulin epsilon receptor subunit gamma [Periophthalmus magnuspinnatus]
MGRHGPLALALPLWMCFGRAAASLHEPQICYVLDGILFLYGLVLTTLYCRLKILSCKKRTDGKPNKGTEDGIYSGLTQPADTYETIGMKT